VQLHQRGYVSRQSVNVAARNRSAARGWRLKLCTSCDLHEFTTTSLCKIKTCKGDSSRGIHKFSKCIICYFAYLRFTEDRNILLHSSSRCTHLTALSETISLYFLKYSPYKKIFKIKCVDLNVICILCHILIFYTTNRSVRSHTVQCVPHVNTKPCLIETNKKQRRTSRTCFASVIGISKRRKLMTDTAFALHPT